MKDMTSCPLCDALRQVDELKRTVDSAAEVISDLFTVLDLVDEARGAIGFHTARSAAIEWLCEHRPQKAPE